MTDEPGAPILDLLRRFRLSSRDRASFKRAGTDATLHNVRVLTAAAIYVNSLAIDDFGGRLGSIRGRGLVEQVVGAAFQTFGGEEPHPCPFDKAAMLLRGITQGHPFTDGNKRTGFLVAALYLDLAEHPYPPKVSVQSAVVLCRRISAGAIRDVAVIAAELERLWSAEASAPEET